MNYLLPFIVLFLITTHTHAQEYAVYLHGLNANIKSASYAPYFEHLQKTYSLTTPLLPGHRQAHQLPELNQQSTQQFFDQLLKLTHPKKQQTTIFAHSMGGILLRNYVNKSERKKFKKIIYLSPGAPPKYYSFLKLLIKLLPSHWEIPSYSPKNLRLNDALPVSAYDFLFKEVNKFINNKDLLPNEHIQVHEQDEVVDTQTLKEHFNQTELIKTKSSYPFHVYFLK